MRRERGFILVNALLIVAALAAAAALLLGRAENGRVRLSAVREVTQTGLYLDGFDALAITLLDRDAQAGEVDHLNEDWASASYVVDVDRGRVAGQIYDQQGLFNLNWLLSDDIPEAADGLRRLARQIGLPQQRVAAIQAFVTGEGDDLAAAYARQPVPLHPRKEPLSLTEELRQVAGLSTGEFQRLRPLITALPPETPLNLNTAPIQVLTSLLPEGNGRVAGALVSARKTDPFTDLEAALAFIDLETDLDSDHLNPLLFGVESRWFLVETAASLGQTTLHRRTVMQRAGPLRRARVVYQLRMHK